MAEEANLLVAPQNNKLERRNSEEKRIYPIGDNSVIDPPRVSLDSSYGDSSGGSSPIKISTPKSKQKVIPHYLRPSTGSCHDLCKYGRRLTDEPNHWRSLPKRIGQPPIEIFVSKKPPVSVERKKVIVMKPMNRDINLSPDHVTVSEGPAEITSSKEVGLSHKGSETGKRMSGIVRKGSNASLDDLFMEQAKVVSRKSSVSDASEGKYWKSPRNDSVKDVKFALTSKSSTSVDASQGKIMRSRSYSVIKDAKTSLASKPPRKNVLLRSKSLNVSLSSTADVNADKRRNLKLVSSTKDQSSSQKVRRSKHKNEEIFKALTGSLSSHGNNHLEDEKNVLAAADEEAKMEGESYKADKLERAEGDTMCMDDKATIPLPTITRGTKPNGKEIALMTKKITKKNGKDIAKGSLAMSPRKRIAVNLKDKDSSLTKMKCQFGRTVELQSPNNSPRKLKFMLGKVLLVNQDAKADVTKNFRKAVVSKVRVNPKSRKVVLRHRSVEGKKDAQGLFNNVIEETASKLVQSRKSKVKALVSAFETVISLQDTKPSSNVVTEEDTLPNS